MYYLLESPEYPCRWMDDCPFHEDLDWDMGVKHTHPVPQPLEFTLEPLNPHSADHGPRLPPYFLAGIPLFRDDLLEAMRRGGANNLDAYEAVIIDPDSGSRILDYKAVNILGLIAAADMGRSQARVNPGGAMLDVDFDSLVVDDSRALGTLIFRLLESNNAILVHERLVEHLRQSGFQDMTFLDPKQCAL
jgi:hypothetical protein